MQLTERARNYLSTLKRDPAWITAAAAAEKYLSKYRLTDSGRLLHIQQQYSGYTFTEYENPDYTVRLRFLSDAIIAKNKKIYYTTVNGKAAFAMDNGKETPDYLLTEDGAIAYYDDEAYTHFCLYESVEVMIEILALEKAYRHYVTAPVKDLQITDLEAFKNSMRRQYSFLKECSDSIQLYWQTDFDIICVAYNAYDDAYSLHIRSIGSYYSDLILKQFMEDNLYI